jgi:2-phospho-L-lactate guanylyltransferase
VSLYAIVPVQRLDLAKSRLASVLTSAERSALVLRLLDTVLPALAGSELVTATTVVSPDPAALEHAAAFGAIPLLQAGSGLNAAIRQGREVARDHGAEELLIVLADLPFLTTAVVDDLLEASAGASVTLAPDRHGTGTNALVLRPLDAIEPAFGSGSYAAHVAAAAARGRSLHTFHAHATAFDVDTPEDLRALNAVFSTAHPL